MNTIRRKEESDLSMVKNIGRRKENDSEKAFAEDGTDSEIGLEEVEEEKSGTKNSLKSTD